MNKIIVLFTSILFLLFLSSIGIAQAYEIIYPVLDYKHKNIPNYCIVRPTDSELNDGQKDWMVEKAEEAVKEWDTTLQSSFAHSYKWQIMSTPITNLNQVEQFKCSWTISFQPEIPSFFVFGVVLGYADIDNQEIVIKYKKIDGDGFHDVLLHEIGHSLGLGHFTTDDNEVMYQWLTSESPPSIMIPNIHQNPGLTYITDVDIDKIKSIYGTGGFLGKYEKENESNQVQLTAIDVLDSLSVSPEKVTVKKYQTNMITIYGKLEKEAVLSGVPIHIITIKPDSSTTVSTIQPASSGNFQIPLTFDNQSPKGEYSIELVYRDRTVSYQSIKYWVEDEFSIKPVQNSEKQYTPVPLWVKNNAKWWSEGLVDDKSFVNGIQYLIENKIILIPNLSAKTQTTTNEIPVWIKNNAGWWANGEISEGDFLKGIEFLVHQGIIRIG